MVEITIRDGMLHLEVLGWSKLWALKSRLTVPLGDVRSIRHDPDARRIRLGWRLPGTHVPGLITAGTYYRGGEKSFWDVRGGDRAVVVELEGASYDRLVVEVENPSAVVSRVRAAISAAGGGGPGRAGREPTGRE